MTYKTLGLVILAIAVLIPIAYADIPPPLKQWNDGIPLEQIRCNTDMILMENSKKPFCVFKDTVKHLKDRGWNEVYVVFEPLDNDIIESSIGHDAPYADGDIQHSGALFSEPNHEMTYEFFGFPVVGETGKLVLTVNHTDRLGYHEKEIDGRNILIPVPYEEVKALELVRLDISAVPAPTVRIYDIVSNIGSDDPDVFLPYNHTTETTIGKPGKVYTVKAKVQVLEEGFVNFLALGLDGDKALLSYAFGKNETLPTWEYQQDGDTYLDHLLRSNPVAGNEEPYPQPIEPLLPEEPSNQSAEEIKEAMELRIATHHIKNNSTQEDILEELTYFHFPVQQIRDFLANRMNYSAVVIDELVKTLPDDYLEGHDEVSGDSHQATFSVMGNITTSPYFFKTGVENVHGIQVCVYDYDVEAPKLIQLENTGGQDACTYTTQSGTYFIPNIVNDDPNDNSNVDLVIRVHSEGAGELAVRNTQNRVYTESSGFLRDFNRDDRVRDFLLTGANAGAGRIIDTLSDGRKLFDDNDVRSTRLNVNWEYNSNAQVFFDGTNPLGPQYFAHTNTIYLNGDSHYTRDHSLDRYTILHEYGHHILDSIDHRVNYICTLLNGQRTHHVYAESLSESCAWGEGWAAFVPHLVDDIARMTYKSDGSIVDLEQERILNRYGLLKYSFDRTRDNMNVGQSVEGQVAATLWDIKDSNVDIKYDKAGHGVRNQVLDDLSLDNDEIIDIIRRQTYSNFEEFYEEWESVSNIPTSFKVMKLHAMEFIVKNTTPISQSQSLSINVGSANIIRLTAQDDDPTLTFSIIDQPTKGKLTKISSGMTYVNYLYLSDFNTPGIDRFTYTVSDGTNTTDEITVVIRINSNISTDTINDNFENLDEWINISSHVWFSSIPLVNIPGENNGNSIAHSDDCDAQCIMILQQPLNTRNPLTISFDRFVSGYIDRGEGLYLQYSTDNTNWITLAEFTDDNRKDSNMWENESILFDISQSNANLRFLAVSSKTNEVIEIDNLSIKPFTNARPIANSQSITLNQDTSKTIKLAGTDADNDPLQFIITQQPQKGILSKGSAGNAFTNYEYAPRSGQTGIDSFRFKVNDGSVDSRIATISITINPVESITFTSLLDHDGSRITLRFSERINKNFQASDFSLSHGTISSIRNFDNSAIRYLQVYGIPYDMPIIVSYTGALLNLGNSILHFGTESTTNSITRPDTPPSIQPISDITIRNGQTRTLSVTASDAENDRIALGLSRSPSFVSINDAGNGRATISIAPTSASNTHTITVTAVANGKSDSESFRITIRSGNGGGGPSPTPSDRVNPIITAPSDRTFEATAIHTPLDSANYGTASATDNRDSSPDITNNAPDSFPIGTVTITWTATDNAGNSASETQRITVQDTVPPVFAPHEDVRIMASDSRSVTYEIPQASDIFTVIISCTPESGQVFSAGTTTINCTAMDTSNNTARTSFNVIISPDDRPPRIIAPADITREATGALTIIDIGSAAVTDDVDPSPTLTNNAPNSFPLGDTIITWTARDSAGNNSTASQSVYVFDATAPIISGMPRAILLEGSQNGTVQNPSNPTAVDLVDGTISPVCDLDPDTMLGLGLYLVTCTARDDWQNSAKVQGLISVAQETHATIHEIGETGTAIVGPDYIHLAFDPIKDKSGYKCIIWTDSYDERIITFTDRPVCLHYGLESETIHAVNVVPKGAGERAIFSHTELTTGEAVPDTTPPSIIPPIHTPYQASGAITQIEIKATITDDRDPDPIITNNSTGAFPLGQSIIEWNATDSSGNFATTHQIITIQDTIPPRFEKTHNIILDSSGLANVTFSELYAHDKFPVTISCNPPSQSVFEPGRTAVECTARDSSGNEATTSFYVIIPRSDFAITDEIDSLEGWTRFAGGHGYPDTIPTEPVHRLELSSEGNPAPSVRIGGENSTGVAGMQKTFSLEGYIPGDPLHFAIDYRAASGRTNAGYTNAALEIVFDGGPYYKTLYIGRASDTGWKTADIGNLNTIIPDDTEHITFRMLYKTFGFEISQNVYMDNLYIGTASPPPKASGGAAGGQAESVPTEISHEMIADIENASLLCALAEYDESLYDEIKRHMQERGIANNCLREP